jgi:two-component system LytT family sensor kinase
LLKEREAFLPLREELQFTDDYLDIEVVRFGDKLKVVKEIAENTLDIVVPGMLLQPLIENSIKHGLEPRIRGGTVTIRSRITEERRLLVEVEDDGVGMAPDRNEASPTSGLLRPGTGIGMRNVRERMEVLYGKLADVEINSRPGRGTKVTLLMPVLDAGAEAWGPIGGAAGQALGHLLEDAVRAMTRS